MVQPAVATADSSVILGLKAHHPEMITKLNFSLQNFPSLASLQKLVLKEACCRFALL